MGNDGGLATLMASLAPADKPLWWVGHGWLVDDVVGSRRPGQLTTQGEQPASWLRTWPCFLAHTLFLGHVVAMGAVMGGWGPTTSSAVQLAVALAIKATWTQ